MSENITELDQSDSYTLAYARKVELLPDLLTIEEVAGYLQVPRKTLYAWRARGDGPPASRVGKHLRYSKAKLLDWLRSNNLAT